MDTIKCSVRGLTFEDSFLERLISESGEATLEYNWQYIKNAANSPPQVRVAKAI